MILVSASTDSPTPSVSDAASNPTTTADQSAISQSVWIGLSLTIVILLLIASIIASCAIYRKLVVLPSPAVTKKQRARPQKKKAASTSRLVAMPRTAQDVEPSFNDFLDDMALELGNRRTVVVLPPVATASYC